MWYMFYEGEIQEFSSKKALEEDMAKLMDNNDDDELGEITVIEGKKCAITVTRLLPTITVTSASKDKVVTKNAKKK